MNQRGVSLWQDRDGYFDGIRLVVKNYLHYTAIQMFVKILLLICTGTTAYAERLHLDHNDSGRVIDCATSSQFSGGFDGIFIKSTDPDESTSDWRRPQNITIRNCEIRGSVQIWGIGPHYTEEGFKDLKKHSTNANFTALARRSAPTEIFFDQCIFRLTRATGIYVGVGSTFVSIRNSSLLFDADSYTEPTKQVVIYLDHESSSNTIQGNYFNIETRNGAGHEMRTRELIAIDGSSDNLIANNYITGLENGGIFLYRNCGERGVVRHGLPVNNKIIENVFYYNTHNDGGAIVFGSRANVTSYCGDEKDSMFGSGPSNQSFVLSNYAYDNVICKLVPVSKRDTWVGPRGGARNQRTVDNFVANEFVVNSDARCIY